MDSDAKELGHGRMLRQEPQAPEARVPLAADHQVIVDGDAQRLGGRLDLARHLDVVTRRLGIARWMVVRQCFMRHTALDFQGRLRAPANRWGMEWGSVVCDPM